MDVRVYAPGEDVQPGGVDLLLRVVGQVRTDGGDAAVRHRDVGEADRRARDDCASADDQVAQPSAASSSRNFSSTSIATATSASSTDSAGLWAVAPLPRAEGLAKPA